MTTPESPESEELAGTGRPGLGAIGGSLRSPGAVVLVGAHAAAESGRAPTPWRLVLLALQSWSRAQVVAAVVATAAIALLMGVATVLIPNTVFAREIAPVWWNYPVWLLTSVLAGALLATYVRPAAAPERRGGRFGVLGAVLGWFAVGCPVCNKIALIALGYTGALTWFAPLQPVLALAALVLTGLALYWRLRGQVLCPLPRRAAVVAR